MTYRSLLFVPGARPERFEKALAAGADAVCIDLEDAVPPEQKATARANVVDRFRDHERRGTALGLRINAIRSADGVRDIAALLDAGARPDFIMLPKAESGEDVAILSAIFCARVPLWPIVESALSLRRAWYIAAAPSVAGILFGGADFAADIGATMDWDALYMARATLVAACASHERALLDVPYLDVRDSDGLTRTTARIRAMGFTGRACIHPDQVAAVNAVFTPTATEVERARRVVEAFELARGAAALLDGKLIDRPVILAAQRILARAAQ